MIFTVFSICLILALIQVIESAVGSTSQETIAFDSEVAISVFNSTTIEAGLNKQRIAGIFVLLSTGRVIPEICVES